MSRAGLAEWSQVLCAGEVNVSLMSHDLSARQRHGEMSINRSASFFYAHHQVVFLKCWFCNILERLMLWMFCVSDYPVRVRVSDACLRLFMRHSSACLYEVALSLLCEQGISYGDGFYASQSTSNVCTLRHIFEPIP